MEGILKFSLPEEKSEFLLAQQGGKYYVTLLDIQNYFRNRLKYNSDNLSEEQLVFLEKVRDDIYDIIKDAESIEIE